VRPPRLGRRRAGRSRAGCRLLAVAAFFSLLALGAAGAAYLFRDQLRQVREQMAEPEPPPAYQSRTLNYSFRYPPAPWEQDRDAERDFPANLVLRRTGPNAWLALVAHDHKDRMPREDELLRGAVSRLRRYFRGLEWEHRDEEALAGRPAQRLVFQGERRSVAMSGECLMTAHQGIAYWFVAWTPSAGDLPAALKEWADVRDGFALLRQREGWTGKVVKLVPVPGKKAGYALRFDEGVWETSDEPGADLTLLGRDPDDPKAALRTATVSVFLRPPAADLDAAVRAARDFAEARQKEGVPDTRVEGVPEAEKSGLGEGPVDLGKLRAQVVRLRVKSGEERERFLALAVVPRPGYTLVFLCECAWAHREAWEERFGPVLHSLTVEAR
jgi:hypothetical protein